MEPINFSKYILKMVIAVYFIGAILGSILIIVSAIHDMTLGVSIESSMFVAYAAYLGGPTATALGFYAWKAKAENVIKIGKSHGLETMETITKVEVF